MGIFASIQHNRIFQRLMRLLQFLSATISLGLFSARLYRILRTVQKAAASDGAVEGILAAAVAYALSSMILRFCLKNGGPKWLRWLSVLLDILFVAGFIAVAVLTRPNGGASGPCNDRLRPYIPDRTNCKLPWGTFILAIVSTLLHAITAIFNEARDHYKQKRSGLDKEEKAYEQQPNNRHY